jgi:hypothetical protein
MPPAGLQTLRLKSDWLASPGQYRLIRDNIASKQLTVVLEIKRGSKLRELLSYNNVLSGLGGVHKDQLGKPRPIYPRQVLGLSLA